MEGRFNPLDPLGILGAVKRDVDRMAGGLRLPGPPRLPATLENLDRDGVTPNPAVPVKKRFIGACRVANGLCETHGHSVSKTVRCPESALTAQEWTAAWEVAEEAFPEGMNNPWINGWWPETMGEALKAVDSYRWRMGAAVRRFREKQSVAIENYERSADKAVAHYREYVMREYERRGPGTPNIPEVLA